MRARVAEVLSWAFLLVLALVLAGVVGWSLRGSVDVALWVEFRRHWVER